MSPEEFRDLCYRLPAAVEEDGLMEERDRMAQEFRLIIVENFVSEVDSQGVPWLPRAQRYPHPPLRKSLVMFEAATVSGAKGNVESNDVDGMTFGISDSEVPYAASQNFGTSRIPAREFFYVRQVMWVRFHPMIRQGLLRILVQETRRVSRSAA